MILDAFELSAENIVILVGVKGHFGKQLVPSLDVVLPPLGISLLLFSLRAGSAVINHSHAEEVKSEDIILAVLGDVVIAFAVLLDVSNGYVFSVLVINGNVVAVLAVFLAVEVEIIDITIINIRNTVGNRCAVAAGRTGRLVRLCRAGKERNSHKSGKHKCCKLFHVFFLHLECIILLRPQSCGQRER